MNNETNNNKGAIYMFLCDYVQVMTCMGGFANGYVAIPPNHPDYAINYADISVDVHGGLTFGEGMGEFKKHKKMLEYVTPIGFNSLDEIPDDYFVYGFDTMHYGDEDMTKEDVVKETERLALWFTKRQKTYNKKK